MRPPGWPGVKSPVAESEIGGCQASVDCLHLKRQPSVCDTTANQRNPDMLQPVKRPIYPHQNADNSIILSSTRSTYLSILVYTSLATLGLFCLYFLVSLTPPAATTNHALAATDPASDHQISSSRNHGPRVNPILVHKVLLHMRKHWQYPQDYCTCPG